MTGQRLFAQSMETLLETVVIFLQSLVASYSTLRTVARADTGQSLLMKCQKVSKTTTMQSQDGQSCLHTLGRTFAMTEHRYPPQFSPRLRWPSGESKSVLKSRQLVMWPIV